MSAIRKAAIVVKEFDALAGEYESNRIAPWYKAHCEEILNVCKTLAVKNVVDVGCGTAYLLRKLCKMKPEIKALGIDLSSQMIAIAERKARAEQIKNLQFMNVDWETWDAETSIDLKGTGIDLIICANTFHYFADPQKAAEKFYNLLNEGGTLIILDRDKATSPLTFLWDLFHRYLIKDHVQFYSRDELVIFFGDAGFKSILVSASIRRYLWKGKLFTSIALLSWQK